MRTGSYISIRQSTRQPPPSASRPPCACSFTDIGHSRSAQNMLAKYKVGTLAEGEVAPPKAAPVGGASHGGSIVMYVLGAAALAAALWFQFLREA